MTGTMLLAAFAGVLTAGGYMGYSVYTYSRVATKELRMALYAGATVGLLVYVGATAMWGGA